MAVNQIQTEVSVPAHMKYFQDSYLESFNFLQARKRRQVRQLVLLNNLQRGDQNIASTLLLTLFNRLLSSLYDDKLQVKFLPSQGIEQEQLTAYNKLAQSDYLEMNKAKIDYDLTWDTLFFGRGYLETYKFNLKRKIMEPCVINPLMFGYDPYFEDVQEWRYYWKWITKSKTEIKRLIKNGTIINITKPEELTSGIDEYLWDYKSLRDKAKKATEPAADSMGGDVFQILEFYGYDENGNKHCYWIDRSFSKVIYDEKLDFEDLDYGKGPKGSKWPIVVKEAMREPHSSVTFSIADLLEDKHRAKSVLLNLAYIAAKDRANPTYLYNPDKVTDITQFFSRQIDQHIPVNDVTGAVVPLNTEDPMSAGLIQFISMLQQEANAPIGTGVTLQPQKNKTSNTATEAAIDQQLNDMAQSLQSKIMQFGESEFWSMWFHRYAKYGPIFKEKMANIVGVRGIDTQMIDMKLFNTDYPPGVLIYSAKEAEYKELVLRQDLMQIYPQLAQTLDHDGFRNFNRHVFFQKFLQDPSMVDVILPKTLDEIKAEGENVQLKDDKYVEIAPNDNHTTHIYTHMMLQPKTWALWFHLDAHEKALAEQNMQAAAAGITPNLPQGNRMTRISENIDFKDLPPDAQAQMLALNGIHVQPGSAGSVAPVSNGQPTAGAPANTSGQPQLKAATINGNKEKSSPIAAATPLKSAINPQANLTNK